jgi:hypothetical protein
MSVRSDRNKETGGDASALLAAAETQDAALGEGNSFCVASPDNPLKRQLVVSIRASLNDLCLQKSKGVWSPSSEALKSIFQQKKFTSLDGAADPQGDLKAVVLHDLTVQEASSSFPISLGTRITGVDDHTFSSTGESFSLIVLPNSNSANEKRLQSDDVSLAYEFAKKFPGYTAENLAEKGIHEVSQRRFVLVAADHPIVSAISENADKLQMGEISMMPEGLVKISQGLYENILPLVKTQVESQIKVRDLSRAQVSIQPAEFATWSDARAELMTEAKRPLKAQLNQELSMVVSEAEVKQIRDVFATREKAIEHEIDHKQLEMHMSLGVAYNFLSK